VDGATAVVGDNGIGASAAPERREIEARRGVAASNTAPQTTKC
jgi:hypothetical protein